MNYNTLKTTKLQALLETATDEERVKIEEVLAKRGVIEAQPAEAPEADDSKLQALEALAEECRKNINHKCQAMPFNTPDWVDGVIAGVNVDRKAGKVSYSIRLNDGRRIAKLHNSSLLRISEELAEESVNKARVRAAEPRKELTAEEREAIKAQLQENVGRKAVYKEVEYLITGLLFDARTQKYLYRTARPETNEMGDTVVIKGFKSSALPLVFSDDRSEEVYESYLKHSNRTPKPAKTVEQLQARVDTLREQLAKAEAALEAALLERDSQTAAPATDGADMM